jgi:hypothetical protein
MRELSAKDSPFALKAELVAPDLKARPGREQNGGQAEYSTSSSRTF